MKRISKKQSHTLSADMWSYYDAHGRHNLAWRKKHSPYTVVVSEIMLQQTQVVRVQEYFKNWMKKYPSWAALARAPLREVLLDWQGLGYNRRGKYLHDIAHIVSHTYMGTLPSDRKSLESLPGIGPYTAGSIRAFAFDQAELFLETNIRTVLFYHYYDYKHLSLKSVDEAELFAVLEKFIASDKRAQDSPRALYYAMMDYGSYLKQTVGNLNTRSSSYTKQSRFEGSQRQLRSQLLRYILHNGPVDLESILSQSQRDSDLVIKLLHQLVQEGSIRQFDTLYQV